jgi:CRP-like cAMP-binding protein
LSYSAKRTIREKLLAFLSDQVIRGGSTAGSIVGSTTGNAVGRTAGNAAGSTVVEIAFNRQELADYLGVDRSALSRELGTMQAEGLIRYHKNRFEITI